ncbi:hypothetical protein FS749_012901, partial [Ceratobasidium sp. UAMH 11750]
MRSSFQVALPNRSKATIRREQLPLAPAYAFADYRAQGQTLRRVIVDIAKPPTGGLTQFNAYVSMSRSQTREYLRLLRDFDDGLFAIKPDKSLLEEDQRLVKLNEETRK